MLRLRIFILSLIFVECAMGQCDCVDCPEPITFNVTTFATAQVSGSTNNILGVNGQSVTNVFVDFEHQAPVEMSLRLIAPNGSFIDLMIGEPVSCGPQKQFDICFVPCNQTAFPDPGFNAVWTSNQAWNNQTSYSGSYYPEFGCLETSLTGNINGTWTIQLTDVFVVCDGNFFDFKISFADNAGLPANCLQVPTCASQPSCIANGGNIPSNNITACVGSPLLNLNINPVGATSSPDYIYKYVLSQNGVIISYTNNTNFTSLPAGSYNVCGLSILSTDEPLLPPPNGSNTITTLTNGINNDSYCADLSNQCFNIIIQAPITIDFVGPTQVCAGQEVIYTIQNYNPAFEPYTAFISMGAFLQFAPLGSGSYSVIWADVVPTGTICVSATNTCGTVEDCINVNIAGPPNVTISGPLLVCPNQSSVYTLTPALSTNQAFDIDVIGGSVTSLFGNQLEILWNNTGPAEICARIITTNSTCEGPETCIDVNIIQVDVPTVSVSDVCVNTQVTYTASTTSSNILSYNWTFTSTNPNLTFTTTTTVPQTTVTWTDAGQVQLCLDVITTCGPEGPVCNTFTIIEAPEPEIVSGGPYCAGQSFEIVANIGSGTSFVWTSNGGSDVIFENPLSSTTLVTVLNPGNYIFTFTETENLCTGFDQASITINGPPEISVLSFVCNQNNNSYTVNFDILDLFAPFSVNGNLITGNTFTSSEFPSGSAYNFIIENDLGCTFEVGDTYTCPCVSNAGSMPLNIVEVCVSGNPTFTISPPANSNLDNNDVGCFYLHDNSSNTLGNVFLVACNGVFTYNSNILNTTTTYYVSYVVGNNLGNGVIDLNDPCTSVSIGQPVQFKEITKPNAGIDKAVCGLVDTLRKNALPIESWSLISAPANATANLTTINGNVIAQVTAPGNFTFRLSVIDGTCIAADTIVVTFNAKPNVTDLSFNCVGGNAFTVSFNITGGQPPYTVNGVTLTTFPYVSPLFPSGSVALFDVKDSRSCNTINPVGGTKNCDCDKDAGTMSKDTISICAVANATFSAQHNSDATFGVNDGFEYVLHDGALNVLGTILDRNKTGTFSFNNYNFNTPYYISYIVANQVNGSLDITDPCLSVSIGQPVFFYENPVVDAGDYTKICGLEVELNASTGGFNGTWIIDKKPNGAESGIKNPDSPNAIFWTIFYGEYTVKWTSINGPCQSSDLATLKIVKPLDFEVSTPICANDQSSYTINISLTGGTKPYRVNGIDIIDSTYTSAPITSGTSYTFTLQDALECDTTITGSFDCNCKSDAGTMRMDTISLCEGEALSTDFSVGDTTMQAGHGYVYVLHTGDDKTLGQILFTTKSSLIPFSPTITPGQVYYLSLVIGLLDNAGNVLLDANCTSVAKGSPVIWKKLVSLQIDDVKVCESISTTAQAKFTYTGTYPFSITLKDEAGAIQNFVVADANALLTITASQDKRFDIVAIDQDCYILPDAQFMIDFIEETKVELRDTSICNNSAFGSVLLFNDLFISAPNSGTWQASPATLLNNGLDFNNITAGLYNVVFKPNIGPDGCPIDEAFALVDVKDCNCPTLELISDTTLCQNTERIDLSSLLVSDDQAVSWTLFQKPPGNNAGFLTANAFITQGKDVGLYGLKCSIVSNTLPDICLKSDTVFIALEPINNISFSQDTMGICANDSSTISLNTLVNNSTGPAKFYNGDFIIQSNPEVNYVSLLTGTNVFYAVAASSSFCPADTALLRIEKYPPGDFSILAEDVSCYNANDGNIQVINPSSTSIIIKLNDQLIEDVGVLSQLPPDIYFVSVEDAQNCIFKFDNITISEPEPITVSLGSNREVTTDELTTITALTNLLSSDISEVTWQSLEGILSTEDLAIVRTFSQNDKITITIIDDAGCIGTDEILISVKEGIFIFPNVINPQSNNGNAVFSLKNTDGLEQITRFSVYDRWGNSVFNQNNIPPQALLWDGSFNGQAVASGVYVFIVKARTFSGKEKVFSGDITVME